MNEVGSSTKPLSQQGKNLADKAVNKARAGAQSSQQATDKASEKVEQVQSDVAPALEKVNDQAQGVTKKGRDVFNDTSKIIRDKAAQATNMALAYTQDEPMKAMLMAAAAGAVLMGLVALMARSPRGE
jgi:ElaB/YqjD/DUF883 family membrane-anchored ribosome-binding protein